MKYAISILTKELKEVKECVKASKDRSSLTLVHEQYRIKQAELETAIIHLKANLTNVKY